MAIATLSPHYRIHRWYEKTLQEEFKRHKLKYEKVPITTLVRGKPRQAHAWKITAGLSEFKKRPLAVFATGTELRMDCVTLPQLQAAAAKFGGPPQELNILNQLIMTQGVSRLGRYQPTRDSITLANRSLAILAHEGLHRLKAKGLLPPREYRALAAAGEQLVRACPPLPGINQRDKKNQPYYPPGPARTEELAAVFVETYYSKQRLGAPLFAGA